MLLLVLLLPLLLFALLALLLFSFAHSCVVLSLPLIGPFQSGIIAGTYRSRAAFLVFVTPLPCIHPITRGFCRDVPCLSRNQSGIPGWIFIGLVGLRDPPKPGVREAIEEMNMAGVQVRP